MFVFITRARKMPHYVRVSLRKIMDNYTLRALFTLKPASACVMKITHAPARTQRPHGVPAVDRLSPLKHFSHTCNKKHCV